MKNKDHAKKAINAMTARALHTKKVAEYIIDNNHFTCQKISKLTGVPQRNISRIIGKLEEVYSFEFEKCYKGRIVHYELINCRFLARRVSSPCIPKESKTQMVRESLRKPLYMNPLWAFALGMQI